ncbi:questin oxidase family protein [Allostreptomyces psammosilenae]|uniref:DUF4243 domain-containing protein n=1 Tax=Allostreptomyces psammosilenae TaxID=1892865 RepID=A0A852ZX74_9ACTN|nr:questin oxidase family protein [Allostreptomyces psammosilenae]NYI06993.1 hypothetical protein [Allostreptomyces psammosilenae]
MTRQWSGTLDEAYQRLHAAGPEHQGWLSNHAPMAVEALARHGHEGDIHRWLDAYADKLEDMPARREPISETDWRRALGDPRRIADWISFFAERLRTRPWQGVLAEWWPRLLPGIAAGATHGVIRVGHAVRELLPEPAAGAAAIEPGPDADGPALPDLPDLPELAQPSPDQVTPPGPRLDELAHALGYWAARWQAVPGLTDPRGTEEPAEALERVPPVPFQAGGIRDRLVQLPEAPGWPGSMTALRPPTDPLDARRLLADLVTAATHRYLTHGHGDGVMLVHAATAPNAVLRTLPALPRRLWVPSVAAAWAASAAVTSAYTPRQPAAPAELSRVGVIAAITASAGTATPEEVATELLELAVEHGDEHVIKLADTAVDVFARTGDPTSLAAAARATQLIPKG